MGLNPEIYIVEVADAFARGRRQQPLFKMPGQRWLPGAMAHVETPGISTERERFTSLAHLITVDALKRSYRMLDAKAGREQGCVRSEPGAESERTSRTAQIGSISGQAGIASLDR